jgi:hypothetical protein
MIGDILRKCLKKIEQLERKAFVSRGELGVD